jgi:hypothetical protein
MNPYSVGEKVVREIPPFGYGREPERRVVTVTHVSPKGLWLTANRAPVNRWRVRSDGMAVPASGSGLIRKPEPGEIEALEAVAQAKRDENMRRITEEGDRRDRIRKLWVNRIVQRVCGQTSDGEILEALDAYVADSDNGFTKGPT